MHVGAACVEEVWRSFRNSEQSDRDRPQKPSLQVPPSVHIVRQWQVQGNQYWPVVINIVSVVTEAKTTDLLWKKLLSLDKFFAICLLLESDPFSPETSWKSRKAASMTYFIIVEVSWMLNQKLRLGRRSRCSHDLATLTCLSVSDLSVQAALQELEELKQIVPKESLVYFLIGKVTVISCPLTL